MPNYGWTIPPRVAEAAGAARYSGLEFLARGAQQQAKRERAGQGKAKDLGVAVRMHGSTIAEISRPWQTPLFVIADGEALEVRAARERPPLGFARGALEN